MEQSDRVARTVDSYIKVRFSDEKAEEKQKYVQLLRQTPSKPPQKVLSRYNLPANQQLASSVNNAQQQQQQNHPTSSHADEQQPTTNPTNNSTPTLTTTTTTPQTTTKTANTLATATTATTTTVPSIIAATSSSLSSSLPSSPLQLIPSCSTTTTTINPTPPSLASATASNHIFLKPSVPGARPHAIASNMLPKPANQSASTTTTSSKPVDFHIPLITSDSKSNSTANQVSSSVTVIETQQPSNIEENPPRIALFTLENSSAVCAQVRNDLKYIALGMENSHINLWISKFANQSLTIEDKLVLIGHSGPVYCIVFLKNDLMISSSEDSTIRLWCLKTLGNICIYHGHNYPIWVLEPSPMGGMFASGSMDGTSKIWSYDSITPIRILSGHDKDVEFVKFHPNERYVATGSCDRTVRMWSVADGRMVRVMVGHKDRIVGLSFLPDGQFLATASAEGCIKLWAIRDMVVKSEIMVPPIRSITFDFERNFSSCCGVDNVLRLWYFNDEHQIEKAVYEKQTTPDAHLFTTCFSSASFNILFAFEYVI